MSGLPIEQALPALRAALGGATAAVLQAPPGAGKTTRVPLALLDEPWMRGARIVMLEPRRLAARAAARRMAATLGEPVGATVGYRVRLDTRVGPRTRIEVVTEGVLTRMLQEDPSLDGTSLVIFDEFHERSVHADLGLALVLQSRALLRDDLRVLVMSATLDGAPVAAMLGDAPVLTSEGRAHPVEVRHRERAEPRRPEGAAAAAVREALRRDDGDVLVFLPGAAEIRRAEALLRGDPSIPATVDVRPLHGTMPAEAQDAAILPAPAGRRKVVLATSIAETSLTIEGVRVVVDTGLSRVPRFSPRIGMSRLETVRVTRSAAEQRRGRAGRTAPGVCYRLWPEAEDAHLVPFARPEILEADLAPLALELARTGVRDPSELRWLDPPPAAAYAQARELLAELGALDMDGRITSHGRRMTELALHPRLAHMILAARERGLAGTACDVAALLGERDLFRADEGPRDADLRLRLEALAARGDFAGAAGRRVDVDARRRVRAEAAELRRRAGAAEERAEVEACGALLALAYPDRVAQRRPGHVGRFLLRNGLGAVFAEPQALADAPYLAVAETDGRRPESRIYLAAPLTLDDLLLHLGGQVAREEVVEWDAESGLVRARRVERLGAIVLAESHLRAPSQQAIEAALVAGIRAAGLESLGWSAESRGIRQRVAFLRALDPAWPDFSDATLLETLPAWLGPHLAGVRRLEELRRIDLSRVLLDALGWERRAALDALAPTHVVVPSGSRIAIDYADPAAPVLAVRLQEMFGLTETPRVAGGRVPLTLHLLSPARRPVQVTRDLAGFWRSTYFEVRKDLKGRYPKHHWPDDPLAAPPTSRAKPRR
ncbi:MAG TPA: ATP-dependent helicase HrpB [Gemmatimonadaceae bacterium]